MLRSFVGSSSFSETDLSTCLSNSGYSVERAAEQLLTGQFQPPSKKFKSSSSSPPLTTGDGGQQPPVVETIVLDTDDDDSRLASSTTTTTKPSAVAAPASVVAPTPKPEFQFSQLMQAQRTPKLLSSNSNTATDPLSSSTSATKKKKHSPTSNSAMTMQPAQVTPTNHHKKKDHSGEWLLCERWISNGTCTQRHGSVGYKEVLDIEWTEKSNSLVLFRGSRIQGQFPKHLSEMLTPLLRYSGTKTAKGEPPIVSLEAEALMEDRGLPIGADVAFSLRYVCTCVSTKQCFSYVSSRTIPSVETIGSPSCTIFYFLRHASF